MKIDVQSLKNILDSKLFESLLEKASFLVTKNKKLSSLAIATLKKLVEAPNMKSLGFGIIKQLRLLANMIYFYAKGQYRDISKKSIAIVIAVISYFLMPFDLVPDFIPGLGYLDDITLIGWVFSTLAGEIQLFEKWFDKYQKAEPIKYIEIKENF